MPITFSCVIPAKDKDDTKLKDLIDSIQTQHFPQDQIEILVITEGDSEQAKGIGIKRASGAYVCMLCADNYFPNKETFSAVYKEFMVHPISACYGRHYHYEKNDNSLNRYFSLMGGNDPICFYLGKQDRKPHFEYTDAFSEIMWFRNRLIPSLGCNGTFINRKQWIANANLDNYYPMDCSVDVIKNSTALFCRRNVADIWHRTSDKLIPFLIKRYKYARDLYCNRKDRRWRMLDTKEDYFRLGLYILFSLTFIQPIYISLRGFSKVRDLAWFWHPIVCLGFLITYTILAIRTFCVRLLSQRWDALNPLKPA